MTDLNLVESAILVKALADAGNVCRLAEYAAVVAVSFGANIDDGHKAVEAYGTTAIDAVRTAAEELIAAVGRTAVTDGDDHERAVADLDARCPVFVDILAAYVDETYPREFKMARWEVEDPQPVVSLNR